METYTKEIDNPKALWRAYEEDFTNLGEFEKEEGDGTIDLVCYKWPGEFDSTASKWQEAKATENESYLLCIVYRSKQCVEVSLQANYGFGPHLQASFDFVKQIAKEHGLVNECVEKGISEGLLSCFDSISFEDIERAIDHYSRDSYFGRPGDNRNCQSWYKTMTLSDVKRLMTDLKIVVCFPS